MSGSNPSSTSPLHVKIGKETVRFFMFGWLSKNSVEKLKKQYEKKLEEAFEAQRNGDIKTFSKLSFEADEILKQIDNEEGKK